MFKMNWTFDETDPYISFEAAISELKWGGMTVNYIKNLGSGSWEVGFSGTTGKLAEIIGCIPWNPKTRFFKGDEEVDPVDYNPENDEFVGEAPQKQLYRHEFSIDDPDFDYQYLIEILDRHGILYEISEVNEKVVIFGTEEELLTFEDESDSEEGAWGASSEIMEIAQKI